MNRDTFEAACNVLDVQYSHIATSGTAYQAAKQKAFYEGAKMMFELIWSEYYSDSSKKLYVDPYGIHRIYD